MKYFLTFLLILTTLPAVALAQQTPTPTTPQTTCSLKSARFLGDVFSGGLQYRPWGKFKGSASVVVEVKTKGCSGKELLLYIFGKGNYGPINATANGIPMKIDDSEGGAIRFNVDEERCNDLKSTSFNIVDGTLQRLLWGTETPPANFQNDPRFTNLMAAAREVLNSPQLLNDVADMIADTASVSGGTSALAAQTLRDPQRQRELFQALATMPNQVPGVTTFGTITDDAQTLLVLQNLQALGDGGGTSYFSTFGPVFDNMWVAVRAGISKAIFYKAGMIDCAYEIRVVDPSQTPDASQNTTTATTISQAGSLQAAVNAIATQNSNLAGRILSNTDPRGSMGFSCAYDGWFTNRGDNCTGTWTAATEFIPGIAGKADETSLCYDTEKGDYNSDCYELLAPIPGFGRRIMFGGPDPTTGKTFTLGTWIGTMIRTAMGAASIAAVLFLMYAGFMYAYSGKTGGGPQLTAAKARITNALFGLLIIASSWIILNTINPDLLELNISFKSITLDAESGDGGVLAQTGNVTLPPGAQKPTKCPEGLGTIIFANGTTNLICNRILANAQKMINDAKTQGIMLNGGSYRDSSTQIDLRKRNCHGDFVSEKPSPACNPDTALPGRSRHENGLAFDFHCGNDGVIAVTTDYRGRYNPRTKVCFDWLSANAANYGFKNYPKENWHWSVDGH